MNAERSYVLSPNLSRSTRLGLLIIAILLVMGLGLARWLEPSPSGIGTHRQLGLPACTIQALFGGRCPSCGMTTAWALAMRLRFHEALHANVAGTLLWGQAMLSVPYLLLMVLIRRDPMGGFFSTATIWGVMSSFALAVILWGTSFVL